jgi:hypothetical protein
MKIRFKKATFRADAKLEFKYLFSDSKNFFCHPREIGDPDKREKNGYQTCGFPPSRE